MIGHVLETTVTNKSSAKCAVEYVFYVDYERC